MAYAYDAENRLIAASPRWPSVGSFKATFAYDYLGRRVAKRVFGYDDANDVWAATPTRARRFIYDGWRPVLELDGADAVIRKYTWGLDLSGSRDGVAGIGGLLATEDPNDPNDATDPNGEFIYAFDANGNVGQLIDWSATYDPNEPDSVNAILPARYAYTPYGQLTSASGDYADENPIRFSTKYWDDETGLGYWGRRYYDGLRWITRDPIEEVGSDVVLGSDMAGVPLPMGSVVLTSLIVRPNEILRQSLLSTVAPRGLDTLYSYACNRPRSSFITVAP